MPIYDILEMFQRSFSWDDDIKTSGHRSLLTELFWIISLMFPKIITPDHVYSISPLFFFLPISFREA